MSSLSAKQLELRAKIERKRVKPTMVKATSPEVAAAAVCKGHDVDEALNNLSRLSPHEKAYERVLDGMRNRGELKPEDDPKHPNYEDKDKPDADYCEICDGPESEDDDLMQCYTDFDGIEHCGKLFHLLCVGRDNLPKGDWICQDCTNLSIDSLHFDRGVIDISGLELRMKNNEDDDDNVSTESPESNLSSDDDDGNDAEYVHHSDDNDDDDDDYDDEDAEDEDFVQAAKKPAPKKPAPKKPASKKPASKKRKMEHDDELFDGDDDLDDLQLNDSNNWVPRGAGECPKTARQQQDAKVRLKVKAIRKPMETLHRQSLPYTRTDADPNDPEYQELAKTESHWPWVVHGAFCFTDQAPNRDGTSDARFLNKPELHMWAGSTDAAKWVANNFKGKQEALGFRVKLHCGYDSYANAFRSDSAKNKTPPPRPSKSTIKNKY